MDIKEIKKVFKNKSPKIDGKYKYFSVLVPLVIIDEETHILFEIRSPNLIQPNEICFPGGQLEKNETPYFASIRETCEELNIKRDKIKIISQLDYLVTPFNMIIYPFLGTLSEYNNNFNRDEVSEIFTVPLSFFINNNPIESLVHFEASTPNDFPYDLINDGEDYNWKKGKYPVLFYQYEDKVIWGITARILYSFIKMIRNN